MWPSLSQWLFELGQFFNTGGWVLFAILFVCFALSLLLMERFIFRVWSYRRLQKQVRDLLDDSLDWRFKRSVVCDLELALKASFPMIKTLIALCPLIGLLGTVTGMIQVFDSLAIYGTGNPRMMASGVAAATFPTMTGMAVAVVALLFYGRLQQWADKERLTIRNLKAALASAKS